MIERELLSADLEWAEALRIHLHGVASCQMEDDMVRQCGENLIVIVSAMGTIVLPGSPCAAPPQVL